MPTKQLTSAQKGAATRKRNKAKALAKQIEEAKRQSTSVPIPVTIAEDDGGSHSIDHGTILDNHVSDDTNKDGQETIDERNTADLSFWNGSWAWTQAKTSYGNKPEDSWFINPTPKLIGEVMTNSPTIYKSCEMALQAGEHQDQQHDSGGPQGGKQPSGRARPSARLAPVEDPDSHAGQQGRHEAQPPDPISHEKQVGRHTLPLAKNCSRSISRNTSARIAHRRGFQISRPKRRTWSSC